MSKKYLMMFNNIFTVTEDFKFQIPFFINNICSQFNNYFNVINDLINLDDVEIDDLIIQCENKIKEIEIVIKNI